jgi:hypothetical protein
MAERSGGTRTKAWLCSVQAEPALVSGTCFAGRSKEAAAFDVETPVGVRTCVLSFSVNSIGYSIYSARLLCICLPAIPPLACRDAQLPCCIVIAHRPHALRCRLPTRLKL